jgi:glycosyltransferase involved in cell wall biosynthesis
MANPEVTVVCITKRTEPLIKLALQSLKEQTFKNFEYILIDGYYYRRKDEIAKLAKDMDIQFPFLHIPDKPSRWRGQRPCIGNARNTGLVFANGTFVVHHDDCCKMVPDWLERHITYLRKGYLVAGSWIGCQGIDEKGDCIPGIYGPDHRARIINKPVEIHPGWLYGSNFSFPLKGALDINGFDEIYDGELGQDDIDFSIRLQRMGYKHIFDPKCLVYFVMMTHTYDKSVRPINKKLRDGIDHFSNELLMQELMDERTRTTPRGNTINIRGSREVLGTGHGFGEGPGKWKYSLEKMYNMMESWIDGNPIDWRDGKNIAEKLKSEQKWE